MVTEVSPWQPSNAKLPIDVTLLGMIELLHPAIKVFDEVSMIALQLSRESKYGLLFSTFIIAKLQQPSKSPLPSIEDTLLGIITEVKSVHLRNAYSLIEATLLGRITEVRLVQ